MDLICPLKLVIINDKFEVCVQLNFSDVNCISRLTIHFITCPTPLTWPCTLAAE
jgi:hypothetical protein